MSEESWNIQDAIDAFERGHLKEAFDLFEVGAKLRNALAKTWLGEMYQNSVLELCVRDIFAAKRMRLFVPEWHQQNHQW